MIMKKFSIFVLLYFAVAIVAVNPAFVFAQIENPFQEGGVEFERGIGEIFNYLWGIIIRPLLVLAGVFGIIRGIWLLAYQGDTNNGLFFLGGGVVLIVVAVSLPTVIGGLITLF